jgi:hypothetical protein
MGLFFNVANKAAFMRKCPPMMGADRLFEALGEAINSVGSSSSPLSLGTTANQNAVGLFAETAATTGDTRLLYARLYFAGAGGSGEAARIFATVNNVTAATGGTVNGAHVTLSVAGASGAVSGAGNALRATLGLGAGTNAGGTLAALQIDSDFAADATLAGAMCAMRLTNSGTGLWANLLQIPDASNGTIFAAHTTQTMTHSIRIRNASGTAYYLMVTNAATNRS